MEDKDVHPLVDLLLARMKSHPEEFKLSTSRWNWVLDKVLDNGSEAEIEAINQGLRPIRLDEAHEWMMDELLNGDERKRVELRSAERQRAYYTYPDLKPFSSSHMSNTITNAIQQEQHSFYGDLKKALGI
jgi:hypothetical protein